MAGRRPAETPQGVAGSHTLPNLTGHRPERKYTMKKQDIRRIYDILPFR